MTVVNFISNLRKGDFFSVWLRRYVLMTFKISIQS